MPCLLQSENVLVILFWRHSREITGQEKGAGDWIMRWQEGS
jgi:hypothetical protein